MKAESEEDLGDEGVILERIFQKLAYVQDEEWIKKSIAEVLEFEILLPSW